MTFGTGEQSGGLSDSVFRWNPDLGLEWFHLAYPTTTWKTCQALSLKIFCRDRNQLTTFMLGLLTTPCYKIWGAITDSNGSRQRHRLPCYPLHQSHLENRGRVYKLRKLKCLGTNGFRENTISDLTSANIRILYLITCQIVSQTKKFVKHYFKLFLKKSL